MKRTEQPIPLRTVICLPRWLMISSVVLCGGIMLAGVALAIYGFATARGGQLGGWLGGAFGCLLGGAGGLFGTLRDWHRRLPAPALLRHLQHDQPLQFYRRVFWPALAAALLGLALACFWSHRIVWHGLVQTGGMLAFVSGGIELIRRHTTKQARAVFALYADGLLDPADAAAIDDAREKDPKFDAAVRDYQRIAAELHRLAERTPPTG